MKLSIRFTSQFKKDLKLAQKQNKDLYKLFDIIEKIANCEPLPEKYKDHCLSGQYSNCRECHIEPDFLMIYRIEKDLVMLMLLRLGSHSELFKKHSR